MLTLPVAQCDAAAACQGVQLAPPGPSWHSYYLGHEFSAGVPLSQSHHVEKLL